MAIAWILAGPFIGLLAGAGVRRLAHPARRTLLALLGVMLVIVVGVVILSASFPGPAVRYATGSVGSIVREWAVSPGIGFILAVPTLVAAIGAAWPQARYQGLITGALAAYGLMPPLALLLLFSGCNHAGACF